MPMLERDVPVERLCQNLGCTRAELRPRHVAVLELMLRGYRNQEIADALAYSLHTVENYVTHILAVSGCRSRTEVILAVLGRRQ